MNGLPRHRVARSLPWLGAWLLGAGLAALLLARAQWDQEERQFDAEVDRAANLVAARLPANDRLLQALVQAQGTASVQRIESKLHQTHPQVLAVLRREGDATWPLDAWRQAEAQSLATRQPHMVVQSGGPTALPAGALGSTDPLGTSPQARGRYALVLAADPASLQGGASLAVALQIDLMAGISWMDWPMVRDRHPMRLTLEHKGTRPGDELVLQDGSPAALLPSAWPLRQRLTLPSQSQAWVLVAQQARGWASLPWPAMASAALLWALVLLASRALLRMRHDRARAEGLLQLGQLGRLNSMAELAGGIARELKSPLQNALNAVRDAHDKLSKSERDLALEDRASAQHARVDALAHAMLAEEEVSHAANVVARLEQVVQQPEIAGRLQPVSLNGACLECLDLLKPLLQRAQVRPQLSGDDVQVLAEPQALREIIHALLVNAVQALESQAPGQRQLELNWRAVGGAATPAPGQGQLSVRDNGPGMDFATLSHIFEPFFTTKPVGLGLGLSLGEHLATAMGGSLAAYNRPEGGAEFVLRLTLAPA